MLTAFFLHDGAVRVNIQIGFNEINEYRVSWVRFDEVGELEFRTNQIVDIPIQFMKIIVSQKKFLIRTLILRVDFPIEKAPTNACVTVGVGSTSVSACVCFYLCMSTW